MDINGNVAEKGQCNFCSPKCMAYRLGQSVKFEDFHWMQQSIFCWHQVRVIAMSFPIKKHVEDGNGNWSETTPHPPTFFPTYVDKVHSLKLLPAVSPLGFKWLT